MSSKMVVRILTISLALLLFGMVVPSQSDASVATEAEVKLDPVLLDSSPISTTFGIQNQNEENQITLYFNLTGTCGFSYDTTLQGKILGPNEVVEMAIQFEPSDLGVCSDTLTVYYYGADFVLNEVNVILTAEVVDQLGPSTVIIDGIDTGVENRLNDDEPFSEHLAKCEENARHHRDYVRCVALMTRKWRKANVCSKQERRQILKAAAFANIPPIEEGLEELEYKGERVLDLIEKCKENAENRKQYRRCARKLIRKMRRADIEMTREQRKKILKYVVRREFRTDWD